MSAGFVGADPEALTQLAQRMSQAAQRLESIRTELTARLGHTYWGGPNADQFRQQWQYRLSPAVASAVSSLQGAARLLTANALEQRVASGGLASLIPPQLAAAGAALRGLFGGLCGDGYGPPAGSTPTQVGAWWSGLSEQERHDAIREHPGTIGGLDGIPAEDRDAANRIVLAQERERIQAELDRFRQDHRWDPTRFLPGSEERALESRLDQLNALDRQLRSHHDYYLLGLDATGDGKAIVAVGNPDTADNVVTYVPGMSTTIGSVPDQLSNMAATRDLAQAVDPAHSTSAIFWLGYDTPNDLVEAMRPDHALAGAEALDRFQDGLHATHQGEAHYVMEAHSYGGKMFGIADREAGLAYDDVILENNPNIGVDRAGQLSVGAGHVYSTRTPEDPVSAGTEFLGDVSEPIAATGAVPSEASFGGHHFTSQDAWLWHAHSSQFDQNSAQMWNKAQIIVGRTEAVF